MANDQVLLSRLPTFNYSILLTILFYKATQSNLFGHSSGVPVILQIKIFFYVRGENESHFLTVQRNHKFLSSVQIWSACVDIWKMIIWKNYEWSPYMFTCLGTH